MGKPRLTARPRYVACFQHYPAAGSVVNINLSSQSGVIFSARSLPAVEMKTTLFESTATEVGGWTGR